MDRRHRIYAVLTVGVLVAVGTLVFVQQRNRQARELVRAWERATPVTSLLRRGFDALEGTPGCPRCLQLEVDGVGPVTLEFAPAWDEELRLHHPAQAEPIVLPAYPYYVRNHELRRDGELAILLARGPREGLRLKGMATRFYPTVILTAFDLRTGLIIGSAQLSETRFHELTTS